MADGSTDPDELTAFAAAVESLSKGTLKIDIESNWRHGQTHYEDGLIGDVRAGKADLGWSGSRAWNTAGVPSFRALIAPFLIDNYELEQRVLESGIVTPMLRGVDDAGLVSLGILPGAIRRPLGVTRPLVQPSDFRGQTIGIQQSTVADVTMRALGARAVWLPIQQVDIRRFGGIEQKLSTIHGWEYDTIARFLTRNVDLWPRPIVLFANRAAFASLSAAQQLALTEAAPSLIPAQVAYDRASDNESAGDICRAGHVRFETATSEQLAELRQAVQPVYAELERDPGTRVAITAITRLKESVPAGPDAVRQCHRSTKAPAPTTQLDGVWTMDDKYSDFPNDPQPVPENYGHWIFVFDRGRFADTQRYLNACTWGYGTFTVKGQQTFWTFIDGGGIAPNHANNKPGEAFGFNWSRYHDTIQLTAAKGVISPGNFMAKPWRLVRSTPSRRFLDKHCPPPAAALP